MKMDAERKADYEKGAGRLDGHRRRGRARQPGQSDHRPPVARLSARQGTGCRHGRSRAATGRCSTTRSKSVVVRQHIDGVWHNGEARDRESGDVMLAVMKTLANLDANERRKKQEGKFGAKYKDHSYMCPIVEPGRADGRARCRCNCLGGYQQALKHYEDLGMRSKLAEQWAALMARDKGLLVIIAGMPEGGLTTLTDVSPDGDRPPAARFRRDRGRAIIASAKSRTSTSRPTTRPTAKRRPRSCPA